MKIAIDVSPISGKQQGHKVRGVGFYLEYLKRALLTYFPENEYVFFTQSDQIDTSVELIHYPYFEPFFVTLPFIKKQKRVITVHDLTPLVFPEHFPAGVKGMIAWNIQKFNLRTSDAIVTDSFASQKDIVRITGIKEDKVGVAYLAAADEFVVLKNKEVKKKELQKKYNLPEKFVLYVGDVTWNKNLPRLIRAVQKIGIPLVMVGKALVDTGYDRTNIWNKDLVEIQRLTNGDKKIMRLGFIPTEDVVGLYNSATVFVFPSLYEGFGLPVLEAMQCGCPVITTKGGSLVEVAGDAAYLVDGYELENIMSGINKVFFSPQLQKEFSRKGLAQAKEFSWKSAAAKTIDIYKNVLRK